MRRQNGFSLIELLIVVAIILAIAAIAVPNLLRSKMSANEASAVASIHTINTSEVTYNSTYPDVGYTDLAALGGAAPCIPSKTSACLVDPTISTPGSTHSGYTFTATPGADTPASTYAVGANPTSCSITGLRSFYSDGSYVIRYTTASGGACTPAGPTDAPVQ
jgi:prepilin-type N-terminal cleavage/methylation domain-containing protein